MYTNGAAHSVYATLHLIVQAVACRSERGLMETLQGCSERSHPCPLFVQPPCKTFWSAMKWERLWALEVRRFPAAQTATLHGCSELSLPVCPSSNISWLDACFRLCCCKEGQGQALWRACCYQGGQSKAGLQLVPLERGCELFSCPVVSAWLGHRAWEGCSNTNPRLRVPCLSSITHCGRVTGSHLGCSTAVQASFDREMASMICSRLCEDRC